MKREYYNNCEADVLEELEGSFITGVEAMVDTEEGVVINIRAIKKYGSNMVPIAFNITRNGCYKRMKCE